MANHDHHNGDRCHVSHRFFSPSRSSFPVNKLQLFVDGFSLSGIIHGSFLSHLLGNNCNREPPWILSSQFSFSVSIFFFLCSDSNRKNSVTMMCDKLRKSVQNLNLGIDDVPIPLPPEIVSRDASINRFTLVVTTVNPRKQNFRGLIGQMPRVWGLADSCVQRIVSPQNVQFKFRNEESMNLVLHRGPWYFNDWMLTVYRWFPNITEEEMKIIPFWVRIHDWNCDESLRFQRNLQFTADENIVISSQVARLRNLCTTCGSLPRCTQTGREEVTIRMTVMSRMIPTPFSPVDTVMASRNLMEDDVLGSFGVLIPAPANAIVLSSTGYISLNISHSHGMPAATFAMAVAGRFSVPTAMLYWISQWFASFMVCLVSPFNVVQQQVCLQNGHMWILVYWLGIYELKETKETWVAKEQSYIWRFKGHGLEPLQTTSNSFLLIKVMRKAFRSFIYTVIAFYKCMKRGLNRFYLLPVRLLLESRVTSTSSSKLGFNFLYLVQWLYLNGFMYHVSCKTLMQ